MTTDERRNWLDFVEEAEKSNLSKDELVTVIKEAVVANNTDFLEIGMRRCSYDKKRK